MNKTLTIAVCILALAGCAKPQKELIPVGVFPTPPAELMVPPAKLEPIPTTSQ